MPLTQQEINKSAIMAVVILKDKKPAQLRKLSMRLSTETQRRAYAEQMRVKLAEITKKEVDEISIAFVTDMTERIYRTIELRLSQEVDVG